MTDLDVQTALPNSTPAHRVGHARSSGGGRAAALCVVIYALLSVFANGGMWAHGIAHSIQSSGGTDVQEEIWFLAQTPWAIVHGINPFANHWLNAPTGVNLMDNTTMPLLGLLGAPITFLFGPIATFNVLVDLAFMSSATACYFMVRRFVTWWPAAFVGGLVYGFSPYAVAEGGAHLFLVFGPFPPLIVLVLDRALRTRTGSPWGNGLALGVCLVGQFYVSAEVLASVVVMMCVAAVVGGIAAYFKRIRIDGRRFFQIAAVTALVFVVCAGYGAWMALAGPQHIVGPAQSPSVLAGISSDPLGLITPTENQHFTLGHANVGDSLVAARDSHWHVIFPAVPENGTYVGVTLLLVLVVGIIVLRRRRVVRFSALMAVVALVLSMGSRLHVDGHLTSIPLPFAIFVHLPLLQSGVASRYVNYFWLFVGLLVAVILDACFSALSVRGSGAQRGKALFVTWAIALFALFPLVPGWPYAWAPAAVPTWYTTTARHLPVGSDVLVYPLASSVDASAMVWQAMANMRFRMPGGYAVFASSSGAATFASAPSSLQEALAFCAEGERFPLSPDAVRSDLRKWRVQLVTVAESAQGSFCATRLFAPALGRPSATDGVLVWHT